MHGADGGRAPTVRFVVVADGGVVALGAGATLVVGASTVVVDANVVDGATVVDVVDVVVDTVLVLVAAAVELVDAAVVTEVVDDDERSFVQPAAATTSVSPPRTVALQRTLGCRDDDGSRRARLASLTGPCRGTARPRR